MLIIGVSGRKQSGKTTLSEHLEPWFTKNQKGSYGNYSFAEPLKQLVCVQVLGLKPEQVFGTDEEKNSLTKYRWENLPMNLRINYSNEQGEVPIAGEIGDDGSETIFYEVQKLPRSGAITAREVMQVVGTDIFRNMLDDNVWVNAAWNAVIDGGKDLSVFTDVRFKSEVEFILANGGYIIRLERHVFEDTHASETELDDYDFESLVKQGRALVVPEDATIKQMVDLATGFISGLMEKQNV